MVKTETPTEPSPTEQSVVHLLDGTIMPQLGYGTWQVTENTADLVSAAIETGYRSIDTAAIYGNERGVGEGIRASRVPRGELFVTTKLWNADQGHDATMRAFDESLEKLGLDYVDLYLIHWPMPGKGLYHDSWRAMARLREQKLIRSVGVSNFLPEHIERIVGEAGVVPVLNQIELHPRFQQRAMRTYHLASTGSGSRAGARWAGAASSIIPPSPASPTGTGARLRRSCCAGISIRG